MLISYSFENFRSFKDKTILSMKASSQTTFNENLIRRHNERVLPCSVIYGANAGGKSNIISSLDFLKNIVIAGSVSQNITSLQNLELCPFAHDSEDKPISFRIDFTNNGKRLVYSLSVLVKVLEHGPRSIVYEQLEIVENKKPITLFIRNENSLKIASDNKSASILKINSETLCDIEQNLIANLDPAELFLSRGFKSIINAEIADTVINFFAEKLHVITDFTLKTATLRVSAKETLKGNFAIWNNILDAFVHGADFGPQNIFFKNKSVDDTNSADMELYSVYGNNKTLIPAILMESRGTLKLIDFALVFQNFFLNGGTFIIDEFDAALHPEIVKGIISLFHDQSLNKDGSQLIFTTHNPIYLNNKIFRRDQIKFVEKDRSSFKSFLYSLADFGSSEVRNDENFLINYFKGKYTSLPFIDFAELLLASDKPSKKGSGTCTEEA